MQNGSRALGPAFCCTSGPYSKPCMKASALRLRWRPRSLATTSFAAVAAGVIADRCAAY